MNKLSTVGDEPDFVSHQVTEARRYFLELRPPRAAPLVVVCGGMECLRSDYVVDRRDFPYHCVEFVREGRGSLQLNGKSYTLGPGMAFAYAPGIPHVIRNDPSAPMKKYYVDFAGAQAAKLLAATPLNSWKPMQVTAPHQLTAVYDALQQEARDQSPLTREISQTLLRLLLLKLRQLALPAGRHMPRAYATYERVRLHIENHYLRLHSVEEIAGECHVTPMYIARLFRRFAGAGAYQFLLRLKMNRAAELLQEGYLVKQTAAALGYTDPFHFSRTFKRVHGLSPDRFADFCGGKGIVRPAGRLPNEQ